MNQSAINRYHRVRGSLIPEGHARSRDVSIKARLVMELMDRMHRSSLYFPALLLTLSALALVASAADAQTAPAPAAQTPAASSPPAQAARPAAPVITTATTTSSPEVREFQKVEDNWSESVNNHDQYGLELVMSPLFVDVSASGDISTRNQQVASTIAADDKTFHIDQRVITVRMLGDVAVVNGTYSIRHKISGVEASEKGIYTHVFQRSHSSWLCVNSQRTLLREDSAAKTQKKQSNAEMPFHIPLFSKGDKPAQ